MLSAESLEAPLVAQPAASSGAQPQQQEATLAALTAQLLAAGLQPVAGPVEGADDASQRITVSTATPSSHP
jgi:hypothetical protein